MGLVETVPSLGARLVQPAASVIVAAMQAADMFLLQSLQAMQAATDRAIEAPAAGAAVPAPAEGHGPGGEAPKAIFRAGNEEEEELDNLVDLIDDS